MCLGALSCTASTAAIPKLHERKSDHHPKQPSEIVVTAEGDAIAKQLIHAHPSAALAVTNPAELQPFRQATNGSTPSGWIQIGTPKKWLLVIFDTGSDKLVAKTWETIDAELSSIDQGVSGMVLPSAGIYNHLSSTSYHRLYMKNGRTGEQMPRQSSITYGSGTVHTDDGVDTVLIGKRNLENFTVEEITADSLQLLHTSSGIAGVLGLQHMKNKSLGNSLFSKMRDADLMTSFGYCRGTGDNGTFIWGDQSMEGTETEVIGQMHWAIKLGGVRMHLNESKQTASLLEKAAARRPKLASYLTLGKFKVRGKRISGPTSEGTQWSNTGGKDDIYDSDGDHWSKRTAEVNDEAEALENMANDIIKEMEAQWKQHSKSLQNTCPDNKCTAILDTGSNIIAGPRQAVKSISHIANVKPDCSNFDDLPTIEMTLGGMDVTIPPSGYVMKVPMPEHGHEDIAVDGDVQSDDSQSDLHGGLTEKSALSAREKTNRRWTAVFARLFREKGIDLREAVEMVIKKHKSTHDKFMCMPAVVPLDKETVNGPLWIVGSPLLETHYARWSYAKEDSSPKIHLKPLKDTEVCKGGSATVLTKVQGSSLLRTQKAPEDTDAKAGQRVHKRGPTERRLEEIAYPHWAKDLLHV